MYGALEAAGFSSSTCIILGWLLYIKFSQAAGYISQISSPHLLGCYPSHPHKVSLISGCFWPTSVSKSPASGFWLLISSLMLAPCAGHDAVQKVTLIPRGQARGLTWFIPGEDPTLISRSCLEMLRSQLELPVICSRFVHQWLCFV